MASIFVTGSSDGLGRVAAALLVSQGHAVVLHARHEAQGREAIAPVPSAAGVRCADLAAVKRLASEAKARGAFDALIHNAAVGYREKQRVVTADGLSHVFAVDTLALFEPTALMLRPKRLIYVSSELHRRGAPGADDLNWERRTWNGTAAYSDTKRHDATLAFAAARRWPAVLANALEPGWVATRMGGPRARMGGPRARHDLAKGHITQAWLAAGDDPAACVSGAARNPARQNAPVAACERFSGVALPP